MTKCACGADHEADHRRGAARERVSRCERWGPPFEVVTEGTLRDDVELRAVQTESGAWEATVYAASYETLAGCEVGHFEFRGLAATEARARALARQATATALAKWAAWHERWDRERAEREAARS